MASQRRSIENTGLPENIEAERYVFGSILLDESLFPQVAEVLDAEDFSVEKHRRIFRRMAELHGRGEHIEDLTLATELTNHGAA